MFEAFDSLSIPCCWHTCDSHGPSAGDSRRSAIANKRAVRVGGRRNVVHGSATVGGPVVPEEAVADLGFGRTGAGANAGHPTPAAVVLAYDVARRVTILFGGHTTKYNDEADEEAYLYQKSHSDRGITHGDTWSFDAATRSWRLLAPKESPPPAATVCGAMVYDSRRSQMILLHPWKPRGPEAKKYNTCQVWSLGSTSRPLGPLGGPCRCRKKSESRLGSSRRAIPPGR